LQKEIITKIIEGKTNAEIAEKLKYSKGNIQKNLEMIYKYFKIRGGNAITKRAILIKEIMQIKLASFM
jgi:DNA-binding CsgD family transcriptional regulator